MQQLLLMGTLSRRESLDLRSLFNFPNHQASHAHEKVNAELRHKRKNELEVEITNLDQQIQVNMFRQTDAENSKEQCFVRKVLMNSLLLLMKRIEKKYRP